MAATTLPASSAGASPRLVVQPESQWSIVWRRFRKHRLAVVSTVLLLLIFVASLLAPIIAPFERDDKGRLNPAWA